MTIPVCKRCRRPSVLNPCRFCASREEAKDYPAEPDENETAAAVGGLQYQNQQVNERG